MIQLEISEFYPSVFLAEMWFGSRFSSLCCVYLRCSAVSVSDSHQGLRSTDAGQTTAKSWWITTLWFTAQYHSHHTHKTHDSSHTPTFSAVNWVHKYFLWTKNTHTYWVQHACVKCQHLSNSSVAGKRVGWFGKQTGVNTITYYRHAQWHSCAHTCTHTDTCILLNPQFKQRTGGLEHSKATVNNNFSFLYNFFLQLTAHSS